MTSILEQKLDKFKAEMLVKLQQRKDRWKEDSVTRDNFDWVSFPIEKVEEHFLDEVLERFPKLANGIPRQHLPESEKQAEDIDVANMAFIDWAMRKARKRPTDKDYAELY